MTSVTDRISELKKERNAIILAHNYCLPEVQDLADHVGDSLGLSRIAAKTDADVIVFCGVSFMGETAKILNPEKMVLLPEPHAHCAMASMCNAEQIRRAREKYPDHAIVGYVNTTAEAKTEMDICCTSGNALNVVKSLEGRKVLFVPDRNLGHYVDRNTKCDVTLWDGFCPVHQGITAGQVMALREKYPEALVLAHPECRDEVLDLVDDVGSTEYILNFCKDSDKKEFIILTEVGMEHRLVTSCPGKTFYFPEHAVCTTMKMIDSQSILDCLEKLDGEIFLSEETIKRAYGPVKRMTDILG